LLGSNSGVLQAGAQLQLPPLSNDEEGLQETPFQLCVPPVIILCSARSDASKQGAAAATAAKNWDSSTGTAVYCVPLLDQVAGDLTACTLEDVFSLLEEGVFDASSISQAAADALLQRAMAAGDDELLLMLVQADICLRCSQLALQLLLGYACQVSCNGSVGSSTWCLSACSGKPAQSVLA
jgi:hypothetical protein